MYAVTDPDCEEDADEATGAESKEKMPDLSLLMMKQTRRQQVPVMKKRKWLLLLRVLDVLAVGEGGHR